MDDKAKIKVIRQEWMDDGIYAWACKEEEARINSYNRQKSLGNKVLIAIKAQHPLTPLGTIGDEYAQRLSEAIRLGYRLTNCAKDVYYATFGGIHDGCESMTLAEAGQRYLAAIGKIAPERVMQFPEALSGNDEDRLAIKAFDEGYSELHIVLSDGQLVRTKLNCISLGWQPFLHPITYLANKPSHSTICELWGDWGVPAFKKGLDEVQRVTEEIVQRHLDEAAK